MAIGRRRYARPPSFTSPQEAELPPQPEYDPRAPLAPLPPTNLPVEDYASPLLHTASFFGKLFRYAVYGSAAIVATTATAFVAVHLYVEHVQLAPPALAQTASRDDPDDWLAEQTGWSGLHTEKRGGTDPRLGVLARVAIRSAFVAQTWGQGLPAAPLSDAASAATRSQGGSSPFAMARMGGDMIGAKHDAAVSAASQGRLVRDGSWLMAERYLVYALDCAAERGITLDDDLSSSWEQRIEDGGVDRAAVELEERLAAVRERIGGRARLEAARDGWERIFHALRASPTSDLQRANERAWEQREMLVATRKLGELSARIAELWQDGTSERRVENAKAEAYFIGGLVPVLSRAVGQSPGGRALDSLLPAGTGTADKHVSPSSSFFGFWSRTHPPATSAAPELPVATPAGPTLSPDLHHLLALVQRASATARTTPTADDTLSRPSTQRALLASLVSLETFLARRKDASPPSTSSNLASAQSVQSAALTYARSLPSVVAPALGSAVSTTSVPSLEPSHVSRTLTKSYRATRIAALETHLAECTLARLHFEAASRGRSLFSTSSNSHNSQGKDMAIARALLASAREQAERAADESAALLALLETEGKTRRAKDVERAFGESIRRARRDAEKVRELGKGLEGFVQAQA